MPPEMTPQTDRGEGTRRRILAVAADAFAERGYARTSLSELVAASGLTKGAFYFHFDSKEDLALEVFRSKHEEWGGKVLAEMGGHGRAIDRLVSIMRTVTGMIERDPSSRCVGRLADELCADPELASVVNRQFDTWVDLSADLVRRGQEEGDIRPDLYPRAVSRVIVAAFIGLERISGTRDDFALGEESERFIELMLAAIRPVPIGM